MPHQQGRSRQLDQRDLPDQGLSRQDQVCRLNPPGLSHPLALAGLVVRGSRQWNGMTDLTLAGDSWKRFLCCRKRQLLPGSAVLRITRTPDSIGDLAAISEPFPSHQPSRTALPSELKTSRRKRLTQAPWCRSTWLHPKARPPRKPVRRRRWPPGQPTRPGWLWIGRKGLDQARDPTGRTSQIFGWFHRSAGKGVRRSSHPDRDYSRACPR